MLSPACYCQMSFYDLKYCQFVRDTRTSSSSHVTLKTISPSARIHVYFLHGVDERGIKNNEDQPEAVLVSQ